MPSRLSRALVGLAAALLLLLPPALAPAAPRPAAGEPLVIAHRGASGHRPEHTVAAYSLGARMGADFIEPDLVATKDRVLVARHENEISGTTDVADRPEFASRRTTKVIDGTTSEGWFTEDFTLAELKTLRAKERIPQLRPENVLYDGRHTIPTFAEVVRVARRYGVGVYPELKHPTYFREQVGIDLEALLLRDLRALKLDKKGSAVFVQSFEERTVRRLGERLDVPVVQLLPAFGSAPTLEQIGTYAEGVGPAKGLVDGAYVDRAHRAGLQVHPYTFRNENAFLPPALRIGSDPSAYGNAFAEYERFFGLGVDGVFSDNPDTADEARDAFAGDPEEARP